MEKIAHYNVQHVEIHICVIHVEAIEFFQIANVKKAFLMIKYL